MDITQLYRDYNVNFATEGHKHTRPGWVNTECPFCSGNTGLHLGYDTQGDKFVCWRCGGHYAPDTISKLLNIPLHEAYDILKKYGVLNYKVPEKHIKIKAKSFKLPNNITGLNSEHRLYLSQRGFDPDFLIKEYNIFGTGVSALLDKLNYKHRIIIPFKWDGKMVSFDSRDITNKAKNKYMACPEAREVIGHKDILYGRQDKWGETGICVEGPTDVWRMGFNSFAVSGIKYKPAQVRCIAKQFKRVFVIFDDESQAIEQAKKLVADLKFRGVEANRISIQGDPGGLSQTEANYLVKQLI